MTNEGEIRLVLDGFLRAVLDGQGPEAIASYLAEHVTGFGVDGRSLPPSPQGAAAALSGMAPLACAPYGPDPMRADILFPAEGAACVSAAHGGLELSLTLRRGQGTWRICALHISAATHAQRLRIALSRASGAIFDYDLVHERLLYPDAPSGELHPALLAGARPLAEYRERLDQALDAVRAGAKQSLCVVRAQLDNGREVWKKLSLTGIPGRDGRMERVVGLVEDITRLRVAEIAYANEEQLRRAYLSGAVASYLINFTRDVVENSSISSPYCLRMEKNTPYHDTICRLMPERLVGEDGRAFLSTFSREPVLRAFERGETNLRLDYRVKDGGDFVWLRTTLRLLSDSLSGDMKGFMYVHDIDAKKRRELELVRRSERDPLTGLYHKGAAVAKIEEALRAPGERGALLMLDVDHFKQINDRYGHPNGDRVLVAVADALRACFREGDVIGRLGGDEFCVFCRGMYTARRLEESARMICMRVRALNDPESTGPRVTCSIGIAICTGRTVKSFDDIYREADGALYRAKERGRDGYVFAQDVSTL